MAVSTRHSGSGPVGYPFITQGRHSLRDMSLSEDKIGDMFLTETSLSFSTVSSRMDTLNTRIKYNVSYKSPTSGHLSEFLTQFYKLNEGNLCQESGSSTSKLCNVIHVMLCYYITLLINECNYTTLNFSLKIIYFSTFG